NEYINDLLISQSSHGCVSFFLGQCFPRLSSRLAIHHPLFLYCLRRVAMYPWYTGVQLTHAPGRRAWGVLFGLSPGSSLLHTPLRCLQSPANTSSLRSLTSESEALDVAATTDYCI